jgi:DNA repair exonuclease SbcCD ATPase subunit
MIIFKTIRWKNFLSTGDNFIEVTLDENPSTLIVGPNGSGKSTLLDALSFALFGKPHRDIKKPQLINSINNRDCEVEVEFSIGVTEYVVRRCIKPNVFEIYQNGTLLNQESHSRDYQKVLEQNILKLNHKSFHQIVVLGSSSFVPFMQLPGHHRREVIEDLLDINVFTKMNGVLKERISQLREKLGHASHELELTQEKIRMQQKHIGDLKNIDAEQHQKNQEKIQTLQDQIQQLMRSNDELASFVQSHQQNARKDLNKAEDLKHTAHTYKIQIDSNIAAVVKDSKFYDDHDSCPKCLQPIQLEFKQKKTHECKTKAKELMEGQGKLIKEVEKINDQFTAAMKIIEECNRRNVQTQHNNSTISNFEKQIVALNRDMLLKQNEDISSAEKELTAMQEALAGLNGLRSTFYEEGTYNQVIAEMLKDTGIKTKVIRQYLPVMNKLINQYLQVLDFFVSFNLNESFEETIRSRHRDEFTYASFSEGEKQRIDLALLFTWRHIARMKNSVSTNLLVLDETFDSSMDSEGVDNLIKILATLEDNTNVLIISHKTDALDGKFKGRIEFSKENSFSSMKQK